MTSPPPPSTGLLATGIYWHTGNAGLTLAHPDGHEDTQRLRPGDQVGWRLTGPRHCTGVWNAAKSTRHPCTSSATVPTGRLSAQCPACAADDRGRALARDAVLDDGRTWAVYLAWFGPGLLKVGITATDRGADRLAEQGALAFTWLGHGSLPTARRTERLVAATGIATERIPRTGKIAAWWQPNNPAERDHELTDAHAHLAKTTPWPGELQTVPRQIHHLADTFGLNQPPPTARHQIAAVTDGSVLSGTLLCLAGRTALIDTAPPTGPAVADLRNLDGWHLASTRETLRGVDLATLPFPGSTHAHDNTHHTLF